MGKKVSIIVPCYNGESYISRLFESIQNQTYSNIELILINDGSTDNTEKISLFYRDKFEQCGFDFIYIYQHNAGQAAALDAGLKVFTGDYLTWLDSDDFLDPQSIEKKVNFLESNKQYGFVRSDAYLYDEKNLYDPTGFISGKKDNRFKNEIFNDLVVGGTFCACGCYLVRADAFLDVNHNKSIYLSRGGQNFQMLLPLASKYKCGYIDEPLYNIVSRQESHSRSIVAKDDQLIRSAEHEDTLRNVINSLDIDKEYYNRIISEKYLHEKLVFAGVYRDKALAEECYSKLKNMGCVTRGDIKSYFMSKNILLNIVIRGVIKVKRVILG